MMEEGRLVNQFGLKLIRKDRIISQGLKPLLQEVVKVLNLIVVLENIECFMTIP